LDDEADDLQFIRCAIYTRQSVLRRGDPALASSKVQRLLCTEFIRSMAWRGWYPIGERFDDEGFSGATVERPGLEKLFLRIREGDVQRVIVYRLDRLTRRLSDWALLVRLFEQFNVGLTIVRGVCCLRGDDVQHALRGTPRGTPLRDRRSRRHGCGKHARRWLSLGALARTVGRERACRFGQHRCPNASVQFVAANHRRCGKNGGK